MPYTPQEWNNDDPTTPLSAARLTHMEDGIDAATDAAEADPAWGDLTGIPAALTSAPAAGTAGIRALGTGATQAAAGTHTHAFASLAGSVEDTTGANLQAILEDLASRLAAIEV